MKINKKKGININDINPEKHIIVGIVRCKFNVKLTIATRTSFFGEENTYCMRTLNSQFTKGNGYGDHNTVKEMIKASDHIKFRVFNGNEWFKAMKWLNRQQKKHS